MVILIQDDQGGWSQLVDRGFTNEELQDLEHGSFEAIRFSGNRFEQARMVEKKLTWEVLPEIK